MKQGSTSEQADAAADLYMKEVHNVVPDEAARLVALEELLPLRRHRAGLIAAVTREER